MLKRIFQLRNLRTRSKNVRWQFSLRMMLFLMLLMCVGLAIFRWPWEDADPERTYITTYRRGWNGKPLKHGPRRIELGRPAWQMHENLFEDDVLRRERIFEPPGTLVAEKLHFPERGQSLSRQFPSTGIVIETTEWDKNLRLSKKWKSPTGQLLESAESVEDLDTYGQELPRITHWNGEPIDEEMARVLADLRSAEERTAWLALLGEHGPTETSFMGDSTYLVRANEKSADVAIHSVSRNAHQSGIWGDFHNHRMINILSRLSTDYGNPNPPRPPPGRPLAHELLAFAHKKNHTLRVRFGVLSLVPISSEGISPTDLTGTLAVKFPAGSTQERDWLEPVVHMRQDIVPHPKRVKLFFAETSIEIDAAQIDLPAQYRPNKPDSEYLRPRRDVLGMFLLSNDLRVEQHENKLIVLPRATKPKR